MLLSKSPAEFLIILLLLFISISCSDKEKGIPPPDYSDNSQLLEIVRKHYRENAIIAFGGYFDDSGKQKIAAGIEVENSDEWGIRFVLLHLADDELSAEYESELLEGSFKESFADKIKFASYYNELLYYNSRSYFMGSGGGEIFSYIVNFEEKQIYYSHLVVEPANEASLFISDNTESRELKNFFNLTFKKDYPNLKIVPDDIIAE